MRTILDELVEAKKQRLDAARARVALAELKARCRELAPPRDFAAALRNGETISVIAELKRSSPSAGTIRAHCPAATWAAGYEQAHAAAISVLTEESRFGGSLDDLCAVSAAVHVPVLRKDFIFDPYQLYEARANGADTVLLIAEVLRGSSRLADLLGIARELGMEPLVEIYEPENVPWVLECGPVVVGVNNRDLRTFRVDLERTALIAPAIPDACVLVSESGIWSVADVERVAAVGVDAVLVGESLMRSHDPAAQIRAFRAVLRRPRGRRHV